MIDKEDCIYTACYCEENVYKLCQTLQQQGQPSSNLYAVFISNPAKKVPLWRQQASSRPDGLVIWDYHVILLEQAAGGRSTLVWDLDTTLPFGCSFLAYVFDTLLARELPPDMQRLYRVVPSDQFFKYFASDRSHMMTADGRWSAPPPAYPCIVADDGATDRISDYWDMQDNVVSEHLGEVMPEQSFLERFGFPV